MIGYHVRRLIENLKSFNNGFVPDPLFGMHIQEVIRELSRNHDDDEQPDPEKDQDHRANHP